MLYQYGRADVVEANNSNSMDTFERKWLISPGRRRNRIPVTATLKEMHSRLFLLLYSIGGTRALLARSAVAVLSQC